MTHILHQISLSLGDHADDYDIHGILADLEEITGGPVRHVDDIDHSTYWAAVKKNDITARKSEKLDRFVETLSERIDSFFDSVDPLEFETDDLAHSLLRALREAGITVVPS